MGGALHDLEAPNAHERPQPVELLPHSLGDAAQALDRVEEGHATSGYVVIPAAGRDELLNYIVWQRVNRHGLRLRFRLRLRLRLLLRLGRHSWWRKFGEIIAQRSMSFRRIDR
eukprot:scaffold77992_cov66-Phaeocystis_antarctica.AAC.1